jgi:hypothetical protein
VHVPPPVEVIRTVVAVTAPLLAAGPKALTQSPTARAFEVTVCVALTGVELDVVILRVSVLGSVGFLLFELFELFVVFDVFDVVPRPKLPAEMSTPDTVTVEPFTPVTLPDAMAMLARALRKLAEPEPLNVGRVPPEPVRPGKPPPPVPLRKLKPPPAVPPAPLVVVREPTPVHDPLALAFVTVMLRATMVVFELFDCVPVAVMQSPAAREPTVSVTVLENAVVGVQLTAVWPVLAF